MQPMWHSLRYYFSRHWLRILLALFPLGLWGLHATHVVNWQWFEKLEYILYDARLRSLAPVEVDPRIVIVDVDEYSLAKLGRWPWSRATLGQLVERIVEEQGARVVGMDFVFAENQGPEDQVFANAIAHTPTILGFYFTNQQPAQTAGVLPGHLDINVDQIAATDRMHTWTGYGASIAPLAAVASGGFFNIVPDTDGLIRRFPLIALYNQHLYESLSLAVMRKLLGSPQLTLETQDHNREQLSGVMLSQKESVFIPTSLSGEVLLPFRSLSRQAQAAGAKGIYTYYPAADILLGKLKRNSLLGKVVLLGSSAPGLKDLRATPVQAVMTGVEMHAQALSTLLDGKFLYVPDYTQALEWLLVASVCLLFAFFLPLLHAGLGLLMASLVFGLIFLSNFVAFQVYGIIWPLAGVLFIGGLSFVLSMSMGYFVETRARTALGRLLRSYVPPELVPGMMRYTDRYHKTAVNKEMTVMFCDLRGFTELAGQLEPAILQKLLSQVFDDISAIILKHGGTIDKYIGDCVMAFWGAPRPNPEHAKFAAKSALEICHSLRQFKPDFPAYGRNAPNLDIHVSADIGLSTGVMSVGDVGSQLRRSYTVMGTAVNLGARLEELAQSYGVQILASEQTHKEAPDFPWKDLGKIKVRGINEEVRVYAL